MALFIYKIGHLVFFFFSNYTFFKQNFIKIAEPYFISIYIQLDTPPLWDIVFNTVNFIHKVKDLLSNEFS